MIRSSRDAPEVRRLLRVIRAAKKLGVYPDVDWRACRWEIGRYDRNRRAHSGAAGSLLFAARRLRRSDPVAPFASRYGDFAKALIRMRASNRAVGVSRQRAILRALQFLYETLQNPHDRCDPTRFTRKHFQLAMEATERMCAPGTAYYLGNALEEIAGFLNTHQLGRTRIHFQNPATRPSTGDGLDAASQAGGLRKMPAEEVLEALAELSSQATEDDECIVLRIIDLLVVAGFRIGEALTLPYDCWVEESAMDPRGRPIMDSMTGLPVKRCGLRYWPEKGGDPIVKWLPDCTRPLAKRAVDDLARLCEPARQAAAVLERNRDRVPLPGNPDSDALLSIRDLMAILPCRPTQGSIRGFLNKCLGLEPHARVRLHGEHNPSCLYRAGDIERALCQRRAALEILRFPGGRSQMLSESLCVVFHNQLCSSRPTLPFLPELVSAGVLSGVLGNRQKNTLFSQHGVTGRDGSPMKIRTHAFRHWLNTLADRGGLSDVELARWMGRKDVRQNEAYKHGTVEQRVTWAREMLAAGKLHGATARAYRGIEDPVEQQEFLAVFVGVAHFTPYGVCIHDFSITPCSYHLNCLAGCSEYLRTQGDEEERRNLIQLRDFTTRQLSKAEQAMQSGTTGAGNWVDFNRRSLTGIEAALAVDDQREVSAK